MTNLGSSSRFHEQFQHGYLEFEIGTAGLIVESGDLTIMERSTSGIVVIHHRRLRSTIDIYSFGRQNDGIKLSNYCWAEVTELSRVEDHRITCPTAPVGNHEKYGIIVIPSPKKILPPDMGVINYGVSVSVHGIIADIRRRQRESQCQGTFANHTVISQLAKRCVNPIAAVTASGGNSSALLPT
ncbi:hypothetical protein BD410DRAFT_878488 [Rickenella mellea]|uniref:Uncharacterized protein n=1 Tax=Rickenella mellea TaxID=50990 RepID=A0A4Y7QIQ2_9AGAM|nr:hypothetical protein BD410DRAFT_878488 [Rickenella mellea]